MTKWIPADVHLNDEGHHVLPIPDELIKQLDWTSDDMTELAVCNNQVVLRKVDEENPAPEILRDLNAEERSLLESGGVLHYHTSSLFPHEVSVLKDGTLKVCVNHATMFIPPAIGKLIGMVANSGVVRNDG